MLGTAGRVRHIQAAEEEVVFFTRPLGLDLGYARFEKGSKNFPCTCSSSMYFDVCTWFSVQGPIFFANVGEVGKERPEL